MFWNDNKYVCWRVALAFVLRHTARRVYRRVVAPIIYTPRFESVGSTSRSVYVALLLIIMYYILRDHDRKITWFLNIVRLSVKLVDFRY